MPVLSVPGLGNKFRGLVFLARTGLELWRPRILKMWALLLGAVFFIWFYIYRCQRINTYHPDPYEQRARRLVPDLIVMHTYELENKRTARSAIPKRGDAVLVYTMQYAASFYDPVWVFVPTGKASGEFLRDGELYLNRMRALGGKRLQLMAGTDDEALTTEGEIKHTLEYLAVRGLGPGARLGQTQLTIICSEPHLVRVERAWRSMLAEAGRTDCELTFIGVPVERKWWIWEYAMNAITTGLPYNTPAYDRLLRLMGRGKQ